MDEILIDEKIYVSSKRAAKMTGYAKDYVGQLCREGRVQARLVGRSWYVLESAIRDHRFGKVNEEETAHPVADSAISSVWEATRYESILSSPLPVVQRHEERTVQAVVEERVPEFVPARPEHDNTEELAEVWRAALVEETVPFFAPEDEVYTPPTRNERKPVSLSRHNERPRSRRILGGTFRLLIVLVALFSLGLAAANSGYLDTYIVSASRASYFTGMHVLTK